MPKSASIIRTKNKNSMQNSNTNSVAKTYTLTLTKEIGKIWILKDVKPFHKKFGRFFEEDLGHDISKVMTSGCLNDVLDVLAGEDKTMDVELKVAPERTNLPGFIELELVETGSLSAKYYVNNCPGKPQMEAWAGKSAKDILKGYPAFAYIKKM